MDSLEGRETIWIGWSGRYSEEGEITTEVKKNVTYILVSLPKTDWDLYYNGFANSSLWPVLHYRVGLLAFDASAFHAYKRINQRFCDVIAHIARPEDVIWVHDYHFFMLGSLLKEYGINNRIGLFFHTPFPPASTFEILPRQMDLGHSLLQYDLLGFQTLRDHNHFLNYAETLGASSSGSHLTYRRQTIATGVFPAEINSKKFADLAKEGEKKALVASLKTSLAGRKLIIGIDRLDYSKGLYERFSGYRLFLKKYPHMHRLVSYLQIAPRSRDNIAAYSDIRRQLERKAGQINGEFADVDWAPLRYLNKTEKRESLAGYLRIAQVGLVTPLRDGMNFVAKEYVAAQDPENPGVLVLSRFAGAAYQLQDALIVNPYDIEEVADAIYQALVMPLDERKARWKQMTSA